MNRLAIATKVLVLALTLSWGAHAEERCDSLRLFDGSILRTIRSILRTIKRMSESELVRPPKLQPIDEQIIGKSMTPDSLVAYTPIEQNVGRGADEALFLLCGHAMPLPCCPIVWR